MTEGVPTATAVVEAAVGTLTMAGEEARTEVSSCALALGCGTDTEGVAARVVGAVVILGVGCTVGRGTDAAGFTVGITADAAGTVVTERTSRCGTEVPTATLDDAEPVEAAAPAEEESTTLVKVVEGLMLTTASEV